MSTDPSPKASTKARAAQELKELLLNAAYLALFLCAFAVYRALIVGEMGDKAVYVHVGASIVTALVIAKTIMIGDWLKLGRRSTSAATPLGVRTLYMTLVYGAFVFVVSVLERVIIGLIHRNDVRQTIDMLAHLGWQEIIARTIVILLALIPYFALRELARDGGRDKVYDLFVHRQPAHDAGERTGRAA